MLSKNNYNERLHKMEEKNERFSIRKFSAGAASVLIGISFMGMANSQTVKADTNPPKEPNADSDPSHVAKTNTNVKDINKVVVDNNANNSNQESNNETEQNLAALTENKVEQKVDTATQANSQAKNKKQESENASETKPTQTTDKNKVEVSTQNLDVSSIENAGMAGRSNSTESKVASDTQALKQDAQEQAEKAASDSQADLVKKATETITMTAPEGGSFQNSDGSSAQSVTATVQASATRSKKVDTVTGEATYSDWTYNPSDKKFAEYKVSNFSGYTPKADADGQTIDLTKKGDDYYIPSTDAFTENGEPIDKKINIKYTADQAKAQIKYIDNNDKKNLVYTQNVVGVTGQVVNFTTTGANGTTKLEVPEGWHLVDGQSYASSMTLGPNNKNAIQTLYIEQNSTVNPDATYTFTINYVNKADNQNVGSQEVTGKTGQKVDYTLQVPTGYDVVKNDQGQVQTGGSITFGSKDSSTTVYVEKHDTSGDVGQPTTQVINFVDTEDNNKLVESRTLDGKIGDIEPLIQDGKIAIELPKGYVATSQQLPDNINFVKDASPIEIKLAHEKSQEVWSDHKGDSNYEKVITETVTYTYPGEDAKTATNQLSYVRNGLKDEVTGKVTYSNWTPAIDKTTGKEIIAFPEIKFSAIKGYTAVYTDNNGQSHTLTPTADNQVVIPAVNAPVDGPSTYNLSLVYNNDRTGKPDDPNATYTFTINYLADKQNVGSQEVSGKAGETVDFSLDGATNTTKLNIPDGYQINGSHPTQITFGPNMQTSMDVNVQKKSDSGTDKPTVKTSKYIINFVDGTNTIATATVTGTVGASVDIADKVKVPDGYKLADGESLETNYIFTDQDVTKNIQVVSTKPDSNKVNVTVNYTYNNEKIGSTTLSVTKGKSQNITGFVKSNVPTGYQVTATIPAQSFNENTIINVPVEKYDPSQDTDKDKIVTQVINYVADGTAVKTQNLTDKVGTSYKVILNGTPQDGEVLIEAPEGYKISQSSISSPIVLQKQSQPITIQVAPIVYSGANSQDAAKYPELTKTVTGVYKYNILGQVSESNPVSIVFYRTGSLDPKTGKMVYTDWKSNMTGGSSDVPSVSLNNIDGYTIKATASTGQEVTLTPNGDKTTVSGVSALKDGQPTDVTINVDYINNETGKPIEPDTKTTTTTLELVDGDTVMAKQTATGLSGTTAKVTLQVPDGYKLAAGVTIPDTITFANEDKTLTYKIVKTTSTDPDHGNTGDDKTEVTQVINYVTESGQVVGTQSVTGQAGTMYQPIIEGTPDKSKNEVLIKAPDNYELAKQEIKPFTLATGAAAISILVNAVIVPEIWDKHKTDPNYYREIKQTVTYNVPGTTPTTNTYQIIYYRSGNYNKATGETTYDKWQVSGQNGATFAEHNVSLASGYTPVVTQDGKQITLEKNADGNWVIPAVMTTPDSKDTTYVVNYDANTVSFNINYVNNANQQVVSSQTITGKTGETVDIEAEIPENWQVVPNTKVPGGKYTFGSQAPEDITVLVEPKTIYGADNKDNPEYYKTVNGTVSVAFPGQEAKVVNQSSVTFIRDAVYNPETKKYDFTAWKANTTDGSTNFGGVKVPVIKEYTISVNASSGEKITPVVNGDTATISGGSALVNGSPENVTVQVTYINDQTGKEDPIIDPSAKEYTYTINYMDGETKVGSQSVTGKKGTTANITAQVPTGYKLANGVTLPTTYTFSDKNETLDVQVVKDSTNPDNPDNPDQEVTQEIQYISDGTVVKTDKLTGKVGTSFKVITSGTAQDGQVLITPPEYYTWSGQTSVPMVINLTKDAKPITFNVSPITYHGNSTENQSNPELYKTVTGTYNFTLPGGSTQQSKTTLAFYRDRSIDPKTGTWKYTDWKSNMNDGATTFALISGLKVVNGYTIKVTTSTGQEVTPSISGNTATISGVSGLKDGQPTDVTVNIDYINDKTGTTDTPVNPDNPDQEYTYTINYNYNGKTINSQSVKGKAGQEVGINLQVPENYQIVSGQQVPNKITFGNQNQSTVVNVEPKVIQGNTEEGKKNPELYKQVTLTYEVATPGQAGETKSGGTLDFYRNATYNLATGKYDYSEWKSNMKDGSTTFNGKMVVPVIDGYDLKVTTSDGQTITPTISDNQATISGISGLVNNEPTNVSVQIQYINKNTGKPDTPDTVHTMTINFINNGDKQVVSTQKVTGKTGETVDFKLDIPTNWEIVPGTSVPSGKYTFGSQDPATQTVLIQPKTIKGNDPANQNNPEVYRTVTDTVIVNYPGKDPVVQNASLSFYRDGTINPSTGKWTYGEWQSNMSDKSTTFPTITVSTINGYTIVATTNDGRTITPLIQGNTATIYGISGLKDGQPSNVTIAINYKNDSTGNEDNTVDPNAKLYTYTINYMNGNKQVGSQTLTGPQGATAQITANVPNGYKLADGVTLPATYTFGDKNETLNVNVVKDTNPDNPDNPDKGDTTTVSGLDDKNNSDLYREITQTITITSPDGKSQSVENHLIFYRDKTTNNKTGKTTYTDWKSNSGTEGHLVTDFGELEVPTLKGYDVVATKDGQTIDLISKDDKLYLPAQPGLVDGTPDNQSISITYNAQTQSVKINFVDKDGQVISTQTVSGKTGENIQLNLDVPKNWQLVPNTTVPTSVTIGANDNKDISVQIEHKLTIIDGRNDQSNPELFKQVTRTIIMNWPGQTAGKSTASLAFYRVATTDEVTGKTTYSKWQSASTTSQYPEQSVSMAGYTAESSDVQLVTKDGKQYVPAMDASFNSEGVPVDSTIIVNYVGDKQEVKINYVENGQTVSTQTLTGRTGQTIAIPLDIPTGYEIADGASVPTQITFGKDTKPMTVEVTKIPAGSQRQTINYVDPNGNTVGSQYVTGKIGSTVDVKEALPINWKLADGETFPTSVVIKDTDTPINIKVVSTTIQVDPSDPKTPGTVIDGAHGQTYPNGLTEQDLNKTVTRTVNIVDPLTGKTSTTVQTVKFARSATVDIATGEVRYGDWTANGNKTFSSIKVPEIDGYTASGSVNEVTPTADYGNQTLTITYTKNGTDTRPDNEKYKPDVSETTSITTNGEIKPEDVIKNADKMPDGTKFEWTDPDKVAEDLKKPGTYKDVGVRITYPDKTTTTVTTTIVVSDKQEASYTQEIIFKDEKTGKEIRSFKFTGPLTDGKATLSADKLKSVIETLFEVIKAGGDTYKNAVIISLPTKDVEVTGGDNAPIVVMVGFDSSKPDDGGNTGDNTDHGDNSGNNSGSDNSGSSTSGSNTSGDTTSDGNKDNNSENTNQGGNTTPTDTDNKDNGSEDTGDNSDYDDEDEDTDETPSKTNHSHKSTSSTSAVAQHANNAQWLANHGYIVTVGAHGQVLSYVKSPDGKGRIITAQPHSQTSLEGASTSALEKAGLAGVKSENNSKQLPQTSDENNDKAAIGLGLVTAAGLLGLAGAEKKRKKE